MRHWRKSGGGQLGCMCCKLGRQPLMLVAAEEARAREFLHGCRLLLAPWGMTDPGAKRGKPTQKAMTNTCLPVAPPPPLSLALYAAPGELGSLCISTPHVSLQSLFSLNKTSFPLYMCLRPAVPSSPPSATGKRLCFISFWMGVYICSENKQAASFCRNMHKRLQGFMPDKHRSRVLFHCNT